MSIADIHEGKKLNVGGSGRQDGVCLQKIVDMDEYHTERGEYVRDYEECI